MISRTSGECWNFSLNAYTRRLESVSGIYGCFWRSVASHVKTAAGNSGSRFIFQWREPLNYFLFILFVCSGKTADGLPGIFACGISRRIHRHSRRCCHYHSSTEAAGSARYIRSHCHRCRSRRRSCHRRQ